MPSEQANHDESDDQVERRVCGRDTAFNEKRKGCDLENIRCYGHHPSHAIFWLFQRIEVIQEGHRAPRLANRAIAFPPHKLDASTGVGDTRALYPDLTYSVFVLWRISDRNSVRVSSSVRKQPSIDEVTADECCFSTPRIIMHRCRASITTPTPCGSIAC